MCKLWLDDQRPPPDQSWYWVTTVRGAISHLQHLPVQVLSLDNDLGEGEPEGRRLVLWLAEHGGWPPEVRVHTANTVAAEYMRGMIARYKP